MSDIVEKTLSSLPRLLSENLLGSISSPASSIASGSGVSGGYQYGSGLSRGFHSLIRNVEYARSVAKEQLIIQKDLSLIQHKLSQPDISVQQTRDYLTRLIFCHMMGYDASCGYIHAVKLAQQGTGWHKWIGYLSCGILLHEDHELIVLLINTILKDLRSTNVLDNCIALTAVSRLVNAEMIPIVLPLVEEKLTHSRSAVRKKAVAALHNIWRKSPNSVPNISRRFSEALCDQDPGVVNVSLILYQSVIKENPSQYKSLGSAFLNILKQILKRKLPTDYDYHSIPNPWMQISLLHLLALLGANDQNFSTEVYPVLKEVLQCANMKENMAFAIIYECILTLTRIEPNPELLEEASRSVGKFLRSSNQNLKYLGMKALTSLVMIAPQYAVDYQMIVMECLENPDSAIQRKTLELMYQMANPVNIEVISHNLLSYISKTSYDPFWQADIVAKLFSLVEKLSSSDKWYVDTLNQLLEVTKGNVPDEIVYRLLNVIDNASKENKDFSHYVYNSYIDYLKKDSLPNTIIQVAVWVLGENPADVINSLPDTDIIGLLLSHCCNDNTSDDCRSWIWMAITKLLHASAIDCQATLSALDSIPPLKMSSETNQRFQELRRLASISPDHDNGVSTVFTLDEMQSFINNSNEMDFTLSFVDDYVSEYLENGGTPFKLNHQYDKNLAVDDSGLFAGLQYGSYYTTTTTTSLWDTQTVASRDGGGGGGANQSINDLGEAGTIIDRGSNLPASRCLQLKGIKQVWSKDGIIQDEAANTASAERDGSFDGLTNVEGKDSLEASSKERSRQLERQQLAAALFAGLPSKDNSSDTQEVTQDMDRMSYLGNPKSENNDLSTEADPMLDLLSLSKNKKGFDWQTLSSKQPDRSENSDTKPEGQVLPETSDLSSEQMLPIAPDTDTLTDNSGSSLYSDFYETLPSEGHQHQVDDLADLLPKFKYGMLPSVDRPKYPAPPPMEEDSLYDSAHFCSEEAFHDANEPIYPAASTTAFGDNLSLKDMPASLFTLATESDVFVVKSCKLKGTAGLTLVLTLDCKSRPVLPQTCHIQLTFSPCLRPSIAMETSIVWREAGTSEFDGQLEIADTDFPLCFAIRLEPIEIIQETLSVEGKLLLKGQDTVPANWHRFSVNLTWIDFSSPRTRTVAQFAESWLQLPYSEKVVSVQPATQQLSATIGQLCLFIPAECIFSNESEALLCGQCLDTVPYLLHMKMIDSTITVLLKSDNQSLLKVLSRYVP